MPEGEGGFKPLDAIRNRIQKTVAEARMPTEGYQSTMMVYGGKLVRDPQNRLVLDRRGPITKLDIIGDYALRTYDEHVVKDPLKFLGRRPNPKQAEGESPTEKRYGSHPRWLVKQFMPGPKRHRGTNTAVDANIRRLGLQDYYGYHPWGIEIKKPELFTKGVPFQDIFRADQTQSAKLMGIDRFQALAEVAQYMKRIHDKYGGIGEGVPYRFIFQKQEGSRVSEPVLFIPDIVYSQDKYSTRRISAAGAGTDQKATDYLEFLISIGFEEFRRSEDWNTVDQALDIANSSYGDLKVISTTESFAKRGRVTMDHPLFSQHNRSHLGFDPKYTTEIRQKVIEACDRYKQLHPPQRKSPLA